MEPWERFLVDQHAVRLMRGKSAQDTRHYEIIFEQKIAGLSEAEKREARQVRQLLDLDYLELRLLSPANQTKVLKHRTLELEAETRARQLAREDIVTKQKGAVALGVFLTILGIFFILSNDYDDKAYPLLLVIFCGAGMTQLVVWCLEE